MKKKIAVWSIWLFSFSIIHGEGLEIENELENISEEKIEIESKTDKNLLKKIIGEIYKYNPNPKDTDVQRKLRTKNLQNYLREINTNWKEKKIQFDSVNLQDVKADTELSPEGLKQSKKIIQQIKNDPGSQLLLGDGNLENNPLLILTIGFQLAFCKACWQETGKYNAIYLLKNYTSNYDSKITIENDLESNEELKKEIEIEVEIYKTFPNENSVINLEKNKITNLVGTIKSINYQAGGFSQPKLTLYLK